MTFLQMREEVRSRLRESASDPRFWSDTDIDTSINEGYREISDATEWNEKFQTINILLDRPYYDMRTVLRTGFLVLGPAFNKTTQRWLTPSTHRDLTGGDLRWEQRVAEPDRVLVRGLWWVGYWPYKGLATGKIKQYYKAVPTFLVEDDDVPGFSERYHYGLVEYALFDLFAQDAEADLAYTAFQAYVGYEQAIKHFMLGRAGMPLMHGHSNEK